jgi:hypothetical protein
MIQQHRPDGAPTPEPDRARRWFATVMAPGAPVVVRHCAMLEHGEDLVEYPPTYELAWPEWTARHDDFGLGLDGAGDGMPGTAPDLTVEPAASAACTPPADGGDRLARLTPGRPS